MTHFNVGIVVPSALARAAQEQDSEQPVLAYIAERLAPYDEGKQVPGYPATCWCIHKYLDSSRFPKLEEAFARTTPQEDNPLSGGDFKPEHPMKQLEEFYRSFRVLFDEPAWTHFRWHDDNTTPLLEDLPAEQRALAEALNHGWSLFYQAYKDTLDAVARLDERYGKPRADCPECLGTGRYIRTYNPSSKWDWYVVGGRWAGMGSGQEYAEVEEQGYFTFRHGRGDLAYNSSPLHAYMDRVIRDPKEACYAFVDRAGVWHERGEMGWFGMSHGDLSQEDWANKLLAVVTDEVLYDDGALFVGLDCHI